MVYKRIIVRGKVQGVFFRASTKEKADELGLQGEVRNLPDETVGILVAGESAPVDELIRWCHQGPPRAKVTAVEVKDMAPSDFDGFKVVRR